MWSQGEGENVVSASMDKPIDENNKGYQLLLKMGWNKNKGLGAKEQGLITPQVSSTSICIT